MKLSYSSCLLAVIFLWHMPSPAGAEVRVSDFDDLSLAADSYWKGPDPNGDPVVVDAYTSGTVGGFTSTGVRYVNRYFTSQFGSLTYNYFSGFAYSNTRDTTTASYTNDYSAFTGTGFGAGNDNYAIGAGYLDDLDPGNRALWAAELPYLEVPATAKLVSARVTNTTYAALSMLNGDGFAKKFGGATGDDPDWFKLSAYGVNSADELVGSTELMLADYRFADSAQDYVLADWQEWDLTPLTGASRIYFNLSSTDMDPAKGMNTPGYFALDNVTYAVVPEPSALGLFAVGILALAALAVVRRRRAC